MTPPTEKPYVLSSQEIKQLLKDTLGMFIEYRDEHGHSEESAQLCAVGEILSGLDAEREHRERTDNPSPLAPEPPFSL